MDKKTAKKQRKRKNRLFYLLLLLMMTTLSLSISSYAWFTTNRLVRVDLLDVNVRAQGGMEISTDGINWKSIISIYDIQDARETYPTSINQVPSTLEPVSTVGELDNGKVKMFYGQATSDINGNYILSSERNIETESFDEESTGKFIAFDMFLKTNRGGQLYLTPESNITYSGTESYGIENAVRVAFVEEGNSTAGADSNTIQSHLTNDNNNVYIWEPNYNTHSEYGIENALRVYGVHTTNNGNKLLYDGVSNEFNSNLGISISNAKNSMYPDYFKQVPVDYYTTSGFQENLPIFNLKDGITKYRVYMWIEGQDVDCENNAAVGNVALNLQFTSNPA